jgi:hypothetical protein
MLLMHDDVEEGSKNISLAYSTELITKRALVNDSHVAPNTPPENAPLNSGSSTASESPVAEHPQLPVPDQDRCAAEAAAQSVTVSDEVNSLAQFNDWQSAAVYLPTPMVSYSVDNVPVPTHATLPPYAVDDPYIPTPAFLSAYAVDDTYIPTPAALPPYGVDHAPIPAPDFLPPYVVDDAYIPTPASLPLYAVDNAPVPPSGSQLPYEVQSIVDNASYEYYGYTTEAVPFDAQLSQPDSWATPDMGVYPQAVYPQDVNQGYFCAPHAGTSSFGMHGLYVN